MIDYSPQVFVYFDHRQRIFVGIPKLGISIDVLFVDIFQGINDEIINRTNDDNNNNYFQRNKIREPIDGRDCSFKH